MKTLMHYKKENLWELEETGFDAAALGKVEAVFSLGNGYLGTRSVTEERYIGERRNTFVAGTFNKFDENEVTELPNVPDMWNMEFLLNGHRLTLEQGEISNYSRTINLKNGLLSRSFEWAYKDIRTKFTFKRFVSFNHRHLMVNHVTIENLTNNHLCVEVISGINGQVSNSGSQHFTDGDKTFVDNKYMQMLPKTIQSDIQFVLTSGHTLNTESKSRIVMERRTVYTKHWMELEGNETGTIEKRSSIYTSIDNDLQDFSNFSIKEAAIEEMRSLADVSFDKLLAESAQAWIQRVWNIHPITIESENFRDQLAIRFAKYHLHVMTPAHDERMNIGAKGLSGEGYKGHTFWDTEIFMLPYFTFTHPEIAEKLVNYRYLGLDGAHKKAASNSYEGAQYPWEAAWPDDGETTPVWGAADIVTGEQTKIWSGFIEQHITSDVTFGVKQFIDVTGNQTWAKEKGYEIIFDTAKFWNSRLEWNGEKEVYEINDVIGPDEYKEHVNNNAFTNYTAHWNIHLALELMESISKRDAELFTRLNGKLGLTALKPQWEEKTEKLYLPQPTNEGIIPQDDTYLSKAILDLAHYKQHSMVGTLFHDYNLDQINEMQITKQADVLLLLFLFENLFEKEIKAINWDYYEPKTTHDSSLSLSTHAILSADLGKLDRSYELFQEAMNIDMGEYMHSSNDGIHAASLGGIWGAVVFGYGGVRVLDGKLRIEPHLPKEWNSLSFGITWRGQKLKIGITENNQFTVKNETGTKEVSFLSNGQIYTAANLKNI